MPSRTFRYPSALPVVALAFVAPALMLAASRHPVTRVDISFAAACGLLLGLEAWRRHAFQLTLTADHIVVSQWFGTRSFALSDVRALQYMWPKRTRRAWLRGTGNRILIHLSGDHPGFTEL